MEYVTKNINGKRNNNTRRNDLNRIREGRIEMEHTPFEIEFKKQLIIQLKELNKNLAVIAKELSWRDHT
jgi:hypothetical protein